MCRDPYPPSDGESTHVEPTESSRDVTAHGCRGNWRVVGRKRPCVGPGQVAQREARHRHRRLRRAGGENLKELPAKTSWPCATSTIGTRQRRCKRFPEGPALPRLSQAARRDAPADRRGGRQHTRPHARPGQPRGDAAGQARLLREAADLEHRGSPADGQDGRASRRSPRRWARRGWPTTAPGPASR